MTMRFQGVEDLPPELKIRALDASARLETKRDELESLDAKIVALDAEGSTPLRKRCRACRSALTHCFEGQAIALKALHTKFLRNGAGLQVAIDREIAAKRVEANENMSMALDPAMRQRIVLDLQTQTQIQASREVMESDRFVLDERGTPQRATGSVLDGAVRIAVQSRETLLKARDATVRDIELAPLPKSLSGQQQSVAELLQQAEARQWVRALGPDEATKWGLQQLESALKADDAAMLARLEASIGPYAAEISRTTPGKIGAELETMNRGAGLREGITQAVSTRAFQITRVLADLRLARIPRDMKLALVIIEQIIVMWQRTCGMGNVDNMTPQAFQALWTSGKITATFSELSWQVDPTWLLRDALGPKGAEALRAIPNMKSAVTAFDMRTWESIRAGRSKGGSP